MVFRLVLEGFGFLSCDFRMSYYGPWHFVFGDVVLAWSSRLLCLGYNVLFVSFFSGSLLAGFAGSFDVCILPVWTCYSIDSCMFLFVVTVLFLGSRYQVSVFALLYILWCYFVARSTRFFHSSTNTRAFFV